MIRHPKPKITVKKSPARRPEPDPISLPEGSNFLPVVEAFAHDGTVSQGRMFGSTALKTDGKVFALLAKGKFVAKLPESRAIALVTSGRAEYFDPGHGRLMKEWISMAKEAECWPGLAKEACTFVKGGRA
jgi:hypothetical protein